MTSTPFTDTTDALAVIASAIGAGTNEPIFLYVATLAFTLSFGVRLGNEQRIEKYLQGIRDKVRR